MVASSSSTTGWKLVSTHTGGNTSSTQCSQPGCRQPRPWNTRWASVGKGAIVAMAVNRACMGTGIYEIGKGGRKHMQPAAGSVCTARLCSRKACGIGGPACQKA